MREGAGVGCTVWCRHHGITKQFAEIRRGRGMMAFRLTPRHEGEARAIRFKGGSLKRIMDGSAGAQLMETLWDYNGSQR